MRPVTRNLVVGLLAVVALLLALGALPALLQSGDPYYLQATPTAGDADDADDGAAVNVSNLSERRYPYTVGAVDAAADRGDGVGRSDPYRTGPFGLKETFAHSPFDEMDALRQQHPAAVDGEAVLVARGGTTYWLELVRA